MGACCFTGHRPKHFVFGTNEEHPQCRQIKAFLRWKIEYLINEENITYFMSGGAVGVDAWAMEEAIKLREDYPQITLGLVLPYEGMHEDFAPRDRERYARMKPHIFKIITLNKRYHSGCMMERNKFMVDNSDFIIAVWNGKKSGTGNTVKYAQKRGKQPIFYNFQ